MSAAHLAISEEAIAAFCKKWGIKELALFGSVLRDDFGPESDVDVLYTMLPDRQCGFHEYFDMKDELEKLFESPVDLVRKSLVEQSPNWIRRRHILSTYRVVYAG